jgi:hypothetical protein
VVAGRSQAQARELADRLGLGVRAVAPREVVTGHLEHARGSGPADQIPLTRNEIAHLLSGMTIRAHDASHQLH